jgi:hypothetical protein
MRDAESEDVSLVAVARMTGVAYLALGVFGLVGSLVIREALFKGGDAARTVANLVEREGLARAGIAVDLAAVLAQALVALGFYRLFCGVHRLAAASIAGFGLVNAVAMVIGVALTAAALDVAVDRTSSSAHDAYLLYQLQGSVWQVAGLFFGLWLLPMGWLVLRSGYMPRALGWLLLAGGVGYVAGTFVHYLLPDATGVVDGLVVLSTAGELWMIGHLLIVGVTDGANGTDRAARVQPARPVDSGDVPAGVR